MNLVVGVRCHYCSKFRSPQEVLHIGGGVVMCWHCFEWHQQAVRMFSGHPPRGCQECGVSFNQLQQSSGDGDVRMYVHAKDGIYQVLCRACSDNYVAKRVDLYRDTPFGHARKLAG